MDSLSEDIVSNHEKSLPLTNFRKESLGKQSDEKFSFEKLEDHLKEEQSSSSKPESSTKSFLDEIRAAALQALDPASDARQDTDESDFESVAALSMVIKPPDDVKPVEFSSDVGSEIPYSNPATEEPTSPSVKKTLKTEHLDGTLKSDVTYSDNFEDDSDAF